LASDKDKDIVDEAIDDVFNSKKGITVNFLGMPIKLDLFNTILGLAIGGTALGTGYLLYNEFANKTTQQKKQEEAEKLRQIQYMNYLQQQQNATKQAVVRESPQEVSEQDGSADLDMSYYQPTKEVPKKLSYNEILTQAEQANPNNPTAYNMNPQIDYNATFPTRHANPPPPPEDRISPSIDMSRLISNNPEPQSPPPPRSLAPAQQRPQQVTEQESAQTQEEIDELYKSMNNY
jgi:hypothetical protein